MLNALLLIFGCQLVGELGVQAVDAPVPGPVVGMALLFAWLLLRRGPSETLQRTADGLLGHLSLLFVPAGVGVILHFRLIGNDWKAITIALVASTVATLLATAFAMRLLARREDEPT